jgi:hypothetical protein
MIRFRRWELDKKTALMVWKWFSLFAVVTVGLMVGLLLMSYLDNLDQTARERWQPDL